MEYTPAKLRYLLTLAELEALLPGDGPRGVRCIDVAVRLGVARASVSRMLGQFTEAGLLRRAGGHSVRLTEKGRQVVGTYRQQYRALFPLFAETLQLPQFEAQECTMALISTLPEQAVETLCQRVSQAV